MKEQGATGTWSKGISGRQSYSAYSQGGFGSFAGSISQRTVVPYETQNNRMVNIKQFLYRPGQAGPESSRTLSQAREGGKVVNPTQRPPLTPPGKHSWYSLLLKAESIPGPSCGQKDYVNGKFQ